MTTIYDEGMFLITDSSAEIILSTGGSATGIILSTGQSVNASGADTYDYTSTSTANYGSDYLIGSFIEPYAGSEGNQGNIANSDALTDSPNGEASFGPGFTGGVWAGPVPGGRGGTVELTITTTELTYSGVYSAIYEFSVVVPPGPHVYTTQLFTSKNDNVNFNALTDAQAADVKSGANIYYGIGGSDTVTLPNIASFGQIGWSSGATFTTGSQPGDSYRVFGGDGSYNLQLGSGSDFVSLSGMGASHVLLGSGDGVVENQGEGSFLVTSASISIAATGNSSVKASGGEITAVLVGKGGNVDIGSHLAPDTDVSFTDSDATLVIERPVDFSTNGGTSNGSGAKISDFGTGDNIELKGVQSIGQPILLSSTSGTSVLVGETTTGTYQLQISGSLASEAFTSSSRTSGTTIVAAVNSAANPTVEILENLSKNVYDGSAGFGGYAPSTILDGLKLGMGVTSVGGRVEDDSSIFGGENFRAQVYFNGTDYVVSIRGTVPLSGNLATDLGTYASGVPTLGLELAVLDTTKILQALRGLTIAPIILTGHSLGGAIAQIEGAASGLEAITFNAPGSAALQDQLDSNAVLPGSLTGGGSTGALINFRDEGDAVSLVGASSTGERNFTLVTPGANDTWFKAYYNHQISTVIGNLSDPGLTLSDNFHEPSILHFLDTPTHFTSTAVSNISQILLGVTTTGIQWFDPDASNAYTINFVSGSLRPSALLFTEIDQATHFYVTVHLAGGWTAPVLIDGSTPYQLPAASDAIEFEAVDATGHIVIIPAGYTFGFDFEAIGTFNATMKAGAGVNFQLVGDASSNIITGGALSETIIGGGGADTLAGGAGSDTFVYTSATDSTASAYDIITDFTTGSDVIDLSAVHPSEVSIIRSGGTSSFIFVTTPDGSMEIGVTGAVNDSDISTGASFGMYLIGDNSGDTLVGSAFGDPIQGGNGGDVIIGGGGSDALFGGTGANVFKYLAASDSNASGYDNIFGFKTGTDKIDLTAVQATQVSLIDSQGSTFLFATTPGGNMQLASVGHLINGDDITGFTGPGVYIIGDNTAETLVGSPGGDPIVGGTGADTIIGGGGADALWGGSGAANVFKYTAASDSTLSAPDNILDFRSGTDKIDLSALRVSASDAYGFVSQNGGTILFVALDKGTANEHDMTILLSHTASITASDILWGSAPASQAAPNAVPTASDTSDIATDAEHHSPMSHDEIYGFTPVHNIEHAFV